MFSLKLVTLMMVWISGEGTGLTLPRSFSLLLASLSWVKIVFIETKRKRLCSVAAWSGGKAMQICSIQIYHESCSGQLVRSPALVYITKL